MSTIWLSSSIVKTVIAGLGILWGCGLLAMWDRNSRKRFLQWAALITSSICTFWFGWMSIGRIPWQAFLLINYSTNIILEYTWVTTIELAAIAILTIEVRRRSKIILNEEKLIRSLRVGKYALVCTSFLTVILTLSTNLAIFNSVKALSNGCIIFVGGMVLYCIFSSLASTVMKNIERMSKMNSGYTGSKPHSKAEGHRPSLRPSEAKISGRATWHNRSVGNTMTPVDDEGLHSRKKSLFATPRGSELGVMRPAVRGHTPQLSPRARSREEKGNEMLPRALKSPKSGTKISTSTQIYEHKQQPSDTLNALPVRSGGGISGTKSETIQSGRSGSRIGQTSLQDTARHLRILSRVLLIGTLLASVLLILAGGTRLNEYPVDQSYSGDIEDRYYSGVYRVRDDAGLVAILLCTLAVYIYANVFGFWRNVCCCWMWGRCKRDEKQESTGMIL